MTTTPSLSPLVAEVVTTSAEDEQAVPPLPAHLSADPFACIPGADGDPDPM